MEINEGGLQTVLWMIGIGVMGMAVRYLLFDTTELPSSVPSSRKKDKKRKKKNNVKVSFMSIDSNVDGSIHDIKKVEKYVVDSKEGAEKMAVEAAKAFKEAEKRMTPKKKASSSPPDSIRTKLANEDGNIVFIADRQRGDSEEEIDTSDRGLDVEDALSTHTQQDTNEISIAEDERGHVNHSSECQSIDSISSFPPPAKGTGDGHHNSDNEQHATPSKEPIASKEPLIAVNDITVVESKDCSPLSATRNEIKTMNKADDCNIQKVPTDDEAIVSVTIQKDTTLEDALAKAEAAKRKSDENQKILKAYLRSLKIEADSKAADDRNVTKSHESPLVVKGEDVNLSPKISNVNYSYSTPMHVAERTTNREEERRFESSMTNGFESGSRSSSKSNSDNVRDDPNEKTPVSKKKNRKQSNHAKKSDDAVKGNAGVLDTDQDLSRSHVINGETVSKLTPQKRSLTTKKNKNSDNIQNNSDNSAAKNMHLIENSVILSSNVDTKETNEMHSERNDFSEAERQVPEVKAKTEVVLPENKCVVVTSPHQISELKGETQDRVGNDILLSDSDVAPLPQRKSAARRQKAKQESDTIKAETQ